MSDTIIKGGKVSDLLQNAVSGMGTLLRNDIFDIATIVPYNSSLGLSYQPESAVAGSIEITPVNDSSGDRSATFKFDVTNIRGKYVHIKFEPYGTASTLSKSRKITGLVESDGRHIADGNSDYMLGENKMDEAGFTLLVPTSAASLFVSFTVNPLESSIDNVDLDVEVYEKGGFAFRLAALEQQLN